MRMNVSTRVCIYCLTEKFLTSFSSRDHVMPRAFGSFNDSPTLDCVCDDCNGQFGRTIELAMGRDSLEALMRLIYGTKPAKQVKELGGRRIKTTLDLDDPDWNGCHIEWVEEVGQVVVTLVPQVGFRRREGSGWVFVTERDLQDTAKALPAEADDPSKGMRIVSPSKEIDERLIGVLARREIRFVKSHETGGIVPSDGGYAPLNVSWRIDDTSLRCVSKIAFNYVAWQQGADFMRLPAFNAIRSFIRYGTQATYPLVQFSLNPILTDDSEGTRQTNGHLVTASWTADKKHIVGRVSLFNSFTYAISLAKDFEGERRPLRSGHHFDHGMGSITRLANERPA